MDWSVCSGGKTYHGQMVPGALYGRGWQKLPGHSLLLPWIMNHLNVDTHICEETVNVRRATKEKMKSDSSRESSSSRKKPRSNNKSESDKSDKKPRPPKKPIELETDTSILQRRQKQIDYGKNTVGYHNYLQQIPIDQRTKEHPKTPEKYTKYSRRSWDTLIKIWRKKLHEYDTNACSDHESDAKSDDSIFDV